MNLGTGKRALGAGNRRGGLASRGKTHPQAFVARRAGDAASLIAQAELVHREPGVETEVSRDRYDHGDGVAMVFRRLAMFSPF